jgi:hypothetical protein
MGSVARTIVSRPTKETGFADRRTHQRFEAQDETIVSPQLTVSGQIVNISLGGLAFRYVASRGRSEESSRLSISLTDSTFNLGMMPFKVVWDVAMPESLFCGAISLRYCGVEFGDLADYQKLGLRFFIHNYTATAAESWRTTNSGLPKSQGGR